MKKWLPLLFVVTVMFFLSAGMANAEKATVTPKLILDGKVLQPKVAPIIMNNYVMVPVRIVTESLGYKVDYDNAKRQITVSGGAKEIVMTVDQPTAYVDGQAKKMDMPPVLQSNSTLIPLRFLSESVGIQVYWDNATKSVFLYSDGSTNTGNSSEGVEAVPPSPGSGTKPEENASGTPDNETPVTTEPGTSPGTAEPGTTDPSTTDPGTTDPGTTNPGTIDSTPTAGKLYEISYASDQVTVKYGGEIAPKISTLSYPERIVIDFPDTDFAPSFYPTLPTDPTIARTGEIQVTGHEALTKVRYSLYSSAPKTIRVVLDLNKSWSYELKRDPTMGDFIIVLNKPTPDKSLYTVVLDAGHGGSDPGAQSLNKRWEKEFNLAIVLKVQKILASDERIKLVLTRSDDTYPTLTDRAQLANSLNADLFLSVHANSYTASTNGTETYYTRDDSLAFAKAMHAAIVPATKLKDGGVRTKNLAVTRETKMPAALLEIGYLSNKTDEAALWNEEFQDRVAQAIAQGLKNYLNLY